MPSWSSYILAGSLLVAPSLALPSTVVPSLTSAEPCGQIADMQAKLWAAQGPKAVLTAPVALATNCLNSVAIDAQAAVAQVEGILKYVQFQSTLAYLKNPPAADAFQQSYIVDPVANLTSLVSDIQSKKVNNEYAFELRLRNIIASANDGHMSASMGALRSIGFTTPFSMASISSDGVALPKVYQIAVENGELTPVGSAVTEIDGLETTEFLTRLAFGTGLQNPDARYNTLFPTHGIAGALVDDSFWRTRRRYPGADSFTMKFENGTTITNDYSATIFGNWTNVRDGPSFYQEFVKKGQIILAPAATNCSSGSGNIGHKMSLKKAINMYDMGSEATVHERLTGGLKPVVTDEGGIFGGYFIKGTDGQQTAVIQLLAFEPECDSQLPGTIAAIAKFLALARRKKVERCVIDLSNNPGGYIVLGYDLFLQLFPDGDTYSGQRMREGSAALIMSNAFKGLNDEVLSNPNITSKALETALQNAPASDWIWQAGLNEDNKPFNNLKEFQGPVIANSDKFSTTWRFNVTDPVTGLGLEDPSLVPGLKAPFKPENIVMMTDGQCSSTCSTFSEFMQTQKNIRQVAVGGIPNAVPMNMVGGVRGSEILDYGTLLAMSDAVNVISPTKNKKTLAARKAALPHKLPLPMSGSVNYLDNIRKGQDTPLQFISEPANCRIFYTKETAGKSEALWGEVADLAFNKNTKAKCAVGSLQQKAGGY